jgi:cytidine deaminase
MDQIKLAKMAKEASTKSYSPYSRAKVGSAVEMDSGKIFYGCNVENSSFGGTVCAERVAIWKAISEGEKLLKTVYVYTKDGWPPCGMCLQVMAEFAAPDLKIIIGNANGEEKVFSFKELLPQAFTPENLKQL